MVVLIDKLDEAAVRKICEGQGNRPEALLEILHEVQVLHDYLSDNILRSIADALNISRAEIHGVVSFYHDYRRKPPARHIVKLCRAEACQAVGSEQLAAYAEEKFGCATGENSVDGQIGLEAVYCLGNCALGPAAMIDGALYGRVSRARLDALATEMVKRGAA